MYVGSDGSGWTLVEDEGEPVPSGFYSTRISSYHGEIAAITGVPESSSALLVMLGAAVAWRRRR
jgi:hypothetical protein